MGAAQREQRKIHEDLPPVEPKFRHFLRRLRRLHLIGNTRRFSVEIETAPPPCRIFWNSELRCSFPRQPERGRSSPQPEPDIPES
ncbi:unnamed protein product [Linum trigynum]|uniref:Uncharacterized protein n=1 Tax=Linum trigynum TaxID=586398 RepID=A0AAV2G7C5_9ROSI